MTAPILSAVLSQNQTRPSGPVAMPKGWEPAVGIVSSVIFTADAGRESAAAATAATTQILRIPILLACAMRRGIASPERGRQSMNMRFFEHGAALS